MTRPSRAAIGLLAVLATLAACRDLLPATVLRPRREALSAPVRRARHKFSHQRHTRCSPSMVSQHRLPSVRCADRGQRRRSRRGLERRSSPAGRRATTATVRARPASRPRRRVPRPATRTSSRCCPRTIRWPGSACTAPPPAPIPWPPELPPRRVLHQLSSEPRLDPDLRSRPQLPLLPLGRRARQSDPVRSCHRGDFCSDCHAKVVP